MSKQTEIPTRARRIVRERSNDQCSRCGGPGREIHHRQRRREAGHAISILVLLCGDDHRWAHANPTEARELGYIISPHETDAASVPLVTFAGKVTFDDEGGVTFV